MKQFINILMLLFSVVTSFGQNVTIDYQAWNPSGTNCNLFVTPTNVPATGTSSGNIEHQRKLGETVYNSSDLSIQMQTIYQTTGAVYKGAKYRIGYNFKANYSYVIYVTAAAVENTLGFPTGPFIRLDANNNGGGGSTGCNGPEILNPNAGGNPPAIKLSQNSFQEFPFVFPQLGNQSTLEISAFPAPDGETKTVRIRKIRIVETPPPPTFTITPISTIVNCGTSVTKTFTVNNVYNSPGTLNHTWNLGASNGWLYQGNPAPSTISTVTNNSITLTSVGSATTLSNVSVGVSLNGSNITNLTSSVNLITPGSSYSILGNDIPCTNATTTYTLGQTPPAGTTVNWSISPNDGTIALTPSGNSVTINAANATLGINYNLSVSITGNCYLGTGSKQFVIPVAPFQGQVYGLQGWYNTLYGAALVEGDNYFYTGSGANYFEVWINNYGEAFAGGYWEHISGDYASYTGGPQFLGFDLFYGGVDAYYNYHFTDNCGSHNIPFHFINSSGYPPNNKVQTNNDPKYQLKLTPNPVNNFIQISVENLTSNVKLKTKLNEKEFDYNTAKRISVFDKLGVLVLQQKAIIPKTGLRLNVSGLRQNEMYNIFIDDGNGNRLSGKFMKLQ